MVIRFFFDHTKDKQVGAWNWKGAPLSHAMGMVFCHHKAPIHRVTHLAKMLADKAKACLPSDVRNQRDLAAYVVLESFDHAGLDLDDYLTDRYGPSIAWKDLVIPGDAMPKWIHCAMRLKDVLPRRRLVPVLRAISFSGDITQAIRDLRSGIDTAALNAFVSAARATPGGPDEKTAWLHLSELWDYLDA